MNEEKKNIYPKLVPADDMSVWWLENVYATLIAEDGRKSIYLFHFVRLHGDTFVPPLRSFDLLAGQFVRCASMSTATKEKIPGNKRTQWAPRIHSNICWWYRKWQRRENKRATQTPPDSNHSNRHHGSKRNNFTIDLPVLTISVLGVSLLPAKINCKQNTVMHCVKHGRISYGDRLDSQRNRS